MTKKELMIKAHKMTKEIKTKYPTIDYKFQLGLCLTYLHEEGENEMVELKGSEKQIKWAEDIRVRVIEATKGAIEAYEEIQVETFNTIGKRRKAYDRHIERLNEMITEYENNDSSKFFIDNFSYQLKNDMALCIDKMMELCRA